MPHVKGYRTTAVDGKNHTSYYWSGPRHKPAIVAGELVDWFPLTAVRTRRSIGNLHLYVVAYGMLTNDYLVLPDTPYARLYEWAYGWARVLRVDWAIAHTVWRKFGNS
jgi:hypothetical protein